MHYIYTGYGGFVCLRERRTKEAMPGWGGGARPPDCFRSKGRDANFASKKVRHQNSKHEGAQDTRAVLSFILWLAAPAASTAAGKGEHLSRSSNPATSSSSCLLPSLPHLLQPLRHDARASAMIYMISCSRGPVTACTLHANLAGLRVLRTAGVSRLESGHVSWEDAWEQWDTVVQQ